MTAPLRDTRDAAAWLGISVSKLQKLVAARAVPFTLIGDRSVRFTQAHLDQIVAAGEQAPIAAPPIAAPPVFALLRGHPPAGPNTPPPPSGPPPSGPPSGPPPGKPSKAA